MTQHVLIVTTRMQRRPLLTSGLHGFGFYTTCVETLEDALHYIETEQEPAIIVIDMIQQADVLRDFIATVRERSQVNIITIGYDVAYEDGCLHLPRRAPVDVVIQSVHSHFTS